MVYSRSEDFSQEKALGYIQTPLIGEPTASLGRNPPVNFGTARARPSWRSKSTTPSYAEIAFRPLLSNPQSMIPDPAKGSHRVFYTTMEDSLPECIPSQGSYLDFHATNWAFAAMPLTPKKFAHPAIEKFLSTVHLGNPGLPPNYPESAEHISKNIIALDLSSMRTSLNPLLKESIQQKSLSDSQVPCEHLGAFSSITERRNRSSGRRKHVPTLRKSSSQSGSWHSVNKPSRCNKDGQFMRMLLGRDSELAYDPKRIISHLRNNIETEEATITETSTESHEDETILQDCQEQSTKIGYLQQFVHLASQFLLGWKTEERQTEPPFVSHGNCSVTYDESPSFQTSHGTSSDIDVSEINTNTTFNESQKSEPDHNLSENVDSLKENFQVPKGGTNVFEMLKRQFAGWTMKGVVPQERRQLLYDIDMGAKTPFVNNQEQALAIHNAASPYLKDFEQSNEIYNDTFCAIETPQDVDYELNGEYASLIRRMFQTEKLPKEETSDCKEETVWMQENARKSGTSEKRSPRDKSLMWLKPRGKRSTRIEQKDNSRKQKNRYMRKGKLKRKTLGVKDGLKSVFREGNGNEAVREYYEEKDKVAGGKEEADTSLRVYRDYYRPAAADDDDDGDGDNEDDVVVDDDDEDELEEDDDEQQKQQQQQQQQQQPQQQQQQQQSQQQQQQKQQQQQQQQQQLHQLLKQLQQQQCKQPTVKEDLSTDSISESTTDSCSLPTLHECNVMRWRDNLVTWGKRRQELMSSHVSNVGDKNKRTQARTSGKLNRDNLKQSVKLAFSKLDLESIENDAVEDSAEKIKQWNIVGKENTPAELEKRSEEGNTLKDAVTVTLCKGNGREGFTDCERQDGECRRDREHYSEQADWKSAACELRLKPQINEFKNSSNLLKETRESERNRPSENIDGFHIARKSFFVNYQMHEDKWTDRRSDKWFREKYRSNEEEHKLLTTGQVTTAENVREKQKLLKEVLEKMDELAGGDKNDENVKVGVPLDKWFSLLDALVKFNEKTDNDVKVKDEQVPETCITNKQDGKSRIGDCVHSDKVDVPELCNRKDFNLNKDILNWIEEGGSVGVKEGGDGKVVEKEATEKKHRERRISHAEQGKFAFEEGVSKAAQRSAEKGKNIVLGDAKSCKAKTKSSRNEYESSASKKGKSKHQATVKVDSGIVERSRNIEQNRNTHKIIETGKSVVVNPLKKRVATSKCSLCNNEEKEMESECSDRSKTLRSINRDIPCSDVNNSDKNFAKINSKGKETKQYPLIDSEEKDTPCSLYGKDTRGQKERYPMKLDFLTSVKENLDNFLCGFDHELTMTGELERINLLCSVLNANLDVENENNIGGTLREEMLIDTSAEDNLGTQDESHDVQESERQQIPSQDVQESERQQIPSQDVHESERQQIPSLDIQESEMQQIPSLDIQESEMQQIPRQDKESEKLQIDLRTSAGAGEARSVDTHETDSYADDSVDRIPGEHRKENPNVNTFEAKVAPLKASAVAVPEESLAQTETLATIQRLLFSAGIVESTPVSFLKQRLLEELEKFSKRNVPPIVEIPEKGSLIEPPKATPMFISRKSLEKVEEFLGFKISSWLARGATTIPEVCSSSDTTLDRPSTDVGGPMSQAESMKSGHPPTDIQSVSESEVSPQVAKLVENNRELTFYRPLLPISPHYKCSCVDCCKSRRGGKPRPRRLRSRRTVVSSEKFRCKTVKNRSCVGTTHNNDAWANSDLERTSCVKPNKRIYSDRFFKKKISISNILKLCKKLPEWKNPVPVPLITEADCNEQEKLRLARCLNAGDFEDKPKEEEDDRISCSPEIQHRSHDDPNVEDELTWSQSFTLPCGFNPNLHGVEHSYLSDSSYKSGSFHNHLYDTCRTFDYLENACAYTRTSPYASPLSQLPIAPYRPYCNISSAGAFFDSRYRNNLYKSPQYTSSGHTTVWPRYRPPSFRQPFLDYLSKNCYSSRRPMLCHDRKPCPVGLSPESCYSSPLLSSWGYSYPRRPTVSTSCPYTYRPPSPRRYTTTNYCSGCDLTRSTSFKNCPGSLSFSIHNYV